MEVQAEPETGLASVDMHRVEPNNVAVGMQVNMSMLTRMNAVFGTIGDNGQELRKLAEAQSEPESGIVCVELWLILQKNVILDMEMTSK